MKQPSIRSVLIVTLFSFAIATGIAILGASQYSPTYIFNGANSPIYTGNHPISISNTNIISLLYGTGLGVDGTGHLYVTSSGSTNPSPSNMSVQFNDSGTFGGSVNFTYNKTDDTVVIGNTSLCNSFFNPFRSERGGIGGGSIRVPAPLISNPPGACAENGNLSVGNNVTVYGNISAQYTIFGGTLTWGGQLESPNWYGGGGTGAAFDPYGDVILPTGFSVPTDNGWGVEWPNMTGWAFLYYPAGLTPGHGDPTLPESLVFLGINVIGAVNTQYNLLDDGSGNMFVNHTITTNNIAAKTVNSIGYRTGGAIGISNVVNLPCVGTLTFTNGILTGKSGTC